jgi:hypothetical protein
MSSSMAEVRTATCCAAITPIRRPGWWASLGRIATRAIESMSAYRQARRETRYLSYLEDASLRELGLDTGQMLSPELEPLGARRRGAGAAWPR